MLPHHAVRETAGFSKLFTLAFDYDSICHERRSHSAAFDDIQKIGILGDETFVGQVEQELATFQKVTGRALTASESTTLREALYQSMRAIWAEIALTHPNFKQVALQLSKEGAAKLGIM